jgi:hypothetical protein
VADALAALELCVRGRRTVPCEISSKLYLDSGSQRFSWCQCFTGICVPFLKKDLALDSNASDLYGAPITTDRASYGSIYTPSILHVLSDVLWIRESCCLDVVSAPRGIFWTFLPLRRFGNPSERRAC